MSALLTGKAVVLQSGGCTAVINRSLAGVVGESRSHKAITGIWGSRFGINGVLHGDLADLRKCSPDDLGRIARAPSAALGSSRHKLTEAETAAVVERFKRWDIRFVFMIGGNDTAATALRIERAAAREHCPLRLIHIPKTIDNDLEGTDHTPGYGSAARFAAITTQEAGLDTAAMRQVDPVKIIELMGRNSGWIVAASALLRRKKEDPPHLLLVPEVPFEERKFLRDVARVLKEVGYCVVVISETIRDAKGQRIGSGKENAVIKDGFGHPYVEGAAQVLAGLVEKTFRVRARFDKPGTIQRMSIPYLSRTDAHEAFLAGVHAVKWAVKGMSSVMVGFKRVPGLPYRIRFVPVDLAKVPDRERKLPAHFLNRERNHISRAFCRFALPLLGKDLPDLTIPALKRTRF
ncbi:MAG: diphosphate--fructose-6-phosphate 1-phosphotransferase [Candidatus Omnitrophota bacterium]